MRRARRQWRSADAMARPEANPTGTFWPPRSQRRRGSTRQREGRAHEAAAHHPARSFRYLRVRARGRARRMGGAGCVRVLRTPDATTLEGKARAAFRSGFLGIDSLGWSTLVQVVEASERGPRDAPSNCWRGAGRALRRARSCHRTAGGRGGDRVCGFAQRSSQGHAGGGVAQHTRTAGSARRFAR